MAAPSEIEGRIASLEQEVARLREKVEKADANRNWLQRLSGTFKDDPSFDEIVKLGAEIRESQRPETHG